MVVSSPQHAAAHFEEIIDKFGATGVWVQYTVALVMWLFAILMPVMVSMSSCFIGFYTRSQEQQSTILVTIVFMFYLIVLLPILGFNFGPDLIEFLTDTTQMTSEKWQVSTINKIIITYCLSQIILLLNQNLFSIFYSASFSQILVLISWTTLSFWPFSETWVNYWGYRKLQNACSKSHSQSQKPNLGELTLTSEESFTLESHTVKFYWSSLSPTCRPCSFQ